MKLKGMLAALTGKGDAARGRFASFGVRLRRSRGGDVPQGQHSPAAGCANGGSTRKSSAAAMRLRERRAGPWVVLYRAAKSLGSDREIARISAYRTHKPARQLARLGKAAGGNEGAPWHARVHLQVSPIWLCMSLQGWQREFWSRRWPVSAYIHMAACGRPVQRPSAREGSVCRRGYNSLLNRLVDEVVQHRLPTATSPFTKSQVATWFDFCLQFLSLASVFRL